MSSSSQQPGQLVGTLAPYDSRLIGTIALYGTRLKGDLTVPATGHSIEDYAGPYEVTPSRATQTLSTEGLRMTGDVVVGPIPRNYGLITWNGTKLTVS